MTRTQDFWFLFIKKKNIMQLWVIKPIHQSTQLTRPSIIACMLSCISLFVTLWTVARQAPLSMEFPRQESWSGLPCLPPEGLPDPRDWTHISCTATGSLHAEPPRKPIDACKCPYGHLDPNHWYENMPAERWPNSPLSWLLTALSESH